MSTLNYCYSTATASKAVFSAGKLETTAEFCPSAAPCTPPPNFIGNFLEMFFFGHYSSDWGTRRDVSEVNIELVSAMLRWQKGVDGAECLCLQHACICLPAPTLTQYAHTEMKSRHISPPPTPRRSICFYKWPQTSAACTGAAAHRWRWRSTCSHVRPGFGAACGVRRAERCAPAWCLNVSSVIKRPAGFWLTFQTTPMRREKAVCTCVRGGEVMHSVKASVCECVCLKEGPRGH